MEVYRFVRELISDDNVLPKSSANEKRNLDRFGVISPSYPFLCQWPKFTVNYFNTFGQTKQMHSFSL